MALGLFARASVLVVMIALLPGLSGWRPGERDSFRSPPSGERAVSAAWGAASDGLHWILNGCETARAEARGEREKAVTVRLDTDGAGSVTTRRQNLLRPCPAPPLCRYRPAAPAMTHGSRPSPV